MSNLDENMNPYIPAFDDPSEPPKILYKYLHPDRVDVLSNLKVRFTPLLGTNDIFEVRRTFHKLIGPKFLRALQHEILSRNLDDELVAKASEHLGVDGNEHREAILAIVKQKLGPDYQAAIQQQLMRMLDDVMPLMNSEAAVEEFLENFASKTLAFSLSESKNNPMMLAHYADQGRGFIVGFETSLPIFNLNKDKNKRPYFKVSYFDELLEEMLDDPFKVLASKTTAWANEQEWRVYAPPEEAHTILKFGTEDVHLFTFEASQVSSVILGHQASAETEQRIRDAMNTSLPNATLTRLTARRFGAYFEETTVERTLGN